MAHFFVISGDPGHSPPVDPSPSTPPPGQASPPGSELRPAPPSRAAASRPTGDALSEAQLPIADIVRTHAPYVWRVARGLGVAEADLDDACQETFLIVHRKLHQFEGRSTLRTWIGGIAVRVAADHRRRARRRRDVPTETPPEQSVHAPQHDALVRRQAWAQLSALLSELREEQRQVFVLYELEGLTMREVAEALGCPLQTAYSRHLSAQKHVQRAAAALTRKESRP